LRPRADTLLVWTGAPCSYGCGACPIDAAAAPPGVQAADLLHALSAVPAREGRLVVLVGGEPFLRPDVFRLLGAIKGAGCVPGVVTTGRPLLYPQVRARLRQAGVAYLRIQLFGLNGAHDRATAVPGGFDQALAGLRAWIAESDAEDGDAADGFQCDVDVALSTRQRSLDTLAADVDGLARALATTAVQILIAVDPAASTAAHETEPLRRAMATLAQWNDDPRRPLLVWEGVPDSAPPGSCLAIPAPRAAFAAGVPRACCLGSIAALADAATTSAPITRANSFNFVRTSTSVPWTADAAACTAHQSAGDTEPHRSAWLVEDGRLVLHVTDTGDFDAAEIARVKDEWSHLFLDRAAAGVLDDFTEGMRRVRPDAICAACAHRGRCGRRFRIVDGAPFAREEKWIAGHIASLRGRVLDVGCGEQLYRNELEPLVRSGTVDYTGLDPDEPSLARLRAVLPHARFHVGGIEDFRGTAASYDHIVCLRSLNHVTDLDEALARMADLLKPGGQLLIVECTPFAMLRRPAQVAAADAAPRAGHQHFRNVASEEVLPFARRHGLQVVEHQRAGGDTTNEWILLLSRGPAGE
jgi:2-polyprenyl-3-methyl-5-hydroxy-6-metoxy-1,4-benzoquinol methylase